MAIGFATSNLSGFVDIATSGKWGISLRVRIISDYTRLPKDEYESTTTFLECDVNTFDVKFSYLQSSAGASIPQP